MIKIKRKKLVLYSVFVSAIIFASMAYSHCQIPCGIYDDQMRFDMIAEHITTIEKSMKLITELSSQDKPNMNQFVRWINNKDDHADEIGHIVSYYFMAQRVKPAEKSNMEEYNDYVNKLTLLHQMLFYSMKAKQTTELENVEKMRSLLDEFHKVYYGKTEADEHKH